MKRRLVFLVALLAMAVTASVAHAAAPEPTTGAWKSATDDQDQAVSFKVRKTDGGYRATSVKAVVGAGCEAPNPNDSTTARTIKVSGVTVNLAPSGSKLKGAKKITRRVAGGKATETVKVSITFVSAKRAKVVVSGKYDTKRDNPKSNADDCGGGLSTTAKPR